MPISLLLLFLSAAAWSQPVLVNEFHLQSRSEFGYSEPPYRGVLYSDANFDWNTGLLALSWEATAFDTYQEKVPYPRIDELYVRWFPLYFVDLRAGRMIRDDGFAEIFSPLELYTGTDLARLARGQFARAKMGRDMAEITLLGSSWFLRGRASWEPPRLTLPDPAEPEFPDRDIPRSVQSRSSDTAYYLGELRVADIPASDKTIDTWGVTAGWSSWFVDVTAAVVDGIRPIPAVEARVSFPDGLTGPYDIDLLPQWVDATTYGLGAQTTIGAARFWSEAAYAVNTAVTVDSDGPGLVVVPAIQTDQRVLDFVGGVSYQLGRPSGIVFAEYRRERWFGDAPEDYRTAFGFTNYVAAGTSIFLDSIRSTIDAVCLFSTDDQSAVLVPSFTWAATDYLNVELTAGAVSGSQTTIFGQLEWPLWAEATVVVRF